MELTKTGVLGESAPQLIERIDFDVLRAMLHARQVACPTVQALQQVVGSGREPVAAGYGETLRALISQSQSGQVGPVGGALRDSAAAVARDGKRT